MRLMRIILVLNICVFLVSVFSMMGCSDSNKAADMAAYDLVLANGRILDGCGNPSKALPKSEVRILSIPTLT